MQPAPLATCIVSVAINKALSKTVSSWMTKRYSDVTSMLKNSLGGNMISLMILISTFLFVSSTNIYLVYLLDYHADILDVLT